MPRTRVDDLAGWTQIAPPPAVDGLTTCTTCTVAQQPVLNLTFYFSNDEFLTDRTFDPFRGFVVYGGAHVTGTREPAAGREVAFYTKGGRGGGGGEKQNTFSETRVKHASKCKAGLHWALIYSHIHIMLHYITSYQGFAMSIMWVNMVQLRYSDHTSAQVCSCSGGNRGITDSIVKS